MGGGWKIATSVNGINWTTINPQMSTVYGIAYGNGLYVAVGDGGKISTSLDGITWTSRINPFPTGIITKVAYGNGKFVVFGVSNLATSPDGITWTLQTTPFINATNGVYFAYGNGLYVVVEFFGQCATSPDGITWTLREKINTTIRTIIYGNGLFISGGAKIYTAQWPAT